MSRVYEYDVSELDGKEMFEKLTEAKRRAFLDFENDWQHIAPDDDSFSAKTRVFNKYI